MKYFSFLSLGLLAVFITGCADTANETYEVDKPVITDPAPNNPAVVPDVGDSDLDADETDIDLNDNDATENDDVDINATAPSVTTPGASDQSPATSGAIENEEALETEEPATP